MNPTLRYLNILLLLFLFGHFIKLGLCQTYSVIDLGNLDGPYINSPYGYAIGDTSASAINTKGQIVGVTVDPVSGYDHAFLYSGGVMKDLGTIAGDHNSYATAINDSGQVVGNSIVSYASGSQNAFLYSDGLMQNLTVWLGTGYNEADGINDSGHVAGASNGNPYLYSNGSVVYLGSLGGGGGVGLGIDSSDQVIGWSYLASTYQHAFLYMNSSMQDLGTIPGIGSGDHTVVASAINASGQIVGTDYADYTLNGFLYIDGVMQSLGTDVRPKGINDHGEIVGWFAPGSISHAFVYLNNSLYDLNNLIPANSSWVLNDAEGVNDSGQIVCNGRTSLDPNPQFSHAVLLTPLPTGAKEAIEAQPSIKVYGIPPSKQSGKDGLVLITHGYTGLNPDISFVDALSNSIYGYFINHELSTWQVYGYKWSNNSSTLLPGSALNNGNEEGINLGNSIANQRWANVHLIAHSAGAGLIETAAAIIKTFSPTTVVQCTFLDPYDGYDFTGISTYGSSADWSDRYCADGDIENAVAPYTDVPLEYSYNIDVTDLDPVVKKSGWFTGFLGLPICTSYGSSHGWPIDFYQNTVTNVMAEYDGFGFPLSLEGGNWNFATNHYHVGNISSITNLGIAPVSCSSSFVVSSPTSVKRVNFSMDQIAWNSDTGTLLANGEQETIHSGSPAWIGVVVQITNAVNIVSFDAEFASSAGAAGLLSVYWDKNTIGSVDERMAIPGRQHYTLSFPVAAVNNPHVLGFRLDPFTNVQSVVTLTNVVLGAAGVSQPFSLSVTTNMVNGMMVYQLAGEPGFDYGLQMSTNLTDWTQIAVLENTTGTVNFSDPDSTNSACRFYRAIAPY
jgi:probable HAF family extracellular repeat protein